MVSKQEDNKKYIYTVLTGKIILADLFFPKNWHHHNSWLDVCHTSVIQRSNQSYATVIKCKKQSPKNSTDWTNPTTNSLLGYFPHRQRAEPENCRWGDADGLGLAREMGGLRPELKWCVRCFLVGPICPFFFFFPEQWCNHYNHSCPSANYSGAWEGNRFFSTQIKNRLCKLSVWHVFLFFHLNVLVSVCVCVCVFVCLCLCLCV